MQSLAKIGPSMLSAFREQCGESIYTDALDMILKYKLKTNPCQNDIVHDCHKLNFIISCLMGEYTISMGNHPGCFFL